MHPDAIAASSNEVVRACFLVDLEFTSGWLYYSTHVKNIVYNGNTYQAVGSLGKLSAIKEDADQVVSDLSIQLTGVIPSQLSIALNEHYQGKTCRMYIALLDENHDVIGEPTVLFKGLIDNQSIALGKTGIITLIAKNRLARLLIPNVRRHNNEDQQSEFPGDKGMEFVEQATRKELNWSNGFQRR